MKKNPVMILTAILLCLAMILGGCAKTNNASSTTAAAAPGTTAAPSTTPAPSAAKTVLKLGNIQNVEAPINMGCVKFAELVAQKSKGQVEVQVYPSSQLGSAPDQLKGVGIGSQDMFVDGWSFEAALSKDWAILATGFVLKDFEQTKKMLASDVGKALFEDLRTKSNIRVIGSNWFRSCRQLYTKKPIKSVNDLAGMKIRVPNKTYFETWKQLGAAPAIIDWAETYGALQQGVVDGTEVPITEYYTSKIFEVAKNVTMLNYMPQIAPLVMNDKKFQSLSADNQKAILDAAAEAGDYMSQLQIDMEAKYVEELKKQGVTFYTPNLDEWIEKAKPLPEKLEADGAWSKGLFEKLQAAIK